MRLVLGENADPQITRINEFRQHEVDQPVGATEGNRRFGPVRGQRIQPLALTAGQDDAQHVGRFPHGSKPIGRCGTLPGGLRYWPRSVRLSVKVIGFARVQITPTDYPPDSRDSRPSNYGAGMRVAMMTREYPPEVYGGAGVHVTELVAQLRRLCAVDVHCMGAPRPGVQGVQVHQPDPRLQGANAAVSTLSADLMMANAAAGASVVHSHTWYTGMAGHLAALLYDVPHVLTAHSLEPLRPWKAEQLGGGHRLSSSVEPTAVNAADAVIAVSSGMREDVLRVDPTVAPNLVHGGCNGISTEFCYPAVAL